MYPLANLRIDKNALKKMKEQKKEIRNYIIYLASCTNKRQKRRRFVTKRRGRVLPLLRDHRRLLRRGGNRLLITVGARLDRSRQVVRRLNQRRQKRYRHVPLRHRLYLYRRRRPPLQPAELLPPDGKISALHMPRLSDWKLKRLSDWKLKEIGDFLGEILGI